MEKFVQQWEHSGIAPTQQLRRNYVAPQCVVIETCVEQSLATVSVGGSVNQPEEGNEGQELSKGTTWTFNEPDEESSSDLYFGEN